jgi:hypothetical protein
MILMDLNRACATIVTVKLPLQMHKWILSSQKKGEGGEGEGEGEEPSTHIRRKNCIEGEAAKLGKCHEYWYRHTHL